MAIQRWTVETLNTVVDAELDALPADMRARFRYISNLIEEFGLERIREPHVKHLHGPLWEMRMRGKDGISRALYVTAIARRVIVVRAFIKKNAEDASSGNTTRAPACQGNFAMTKVNDLHKKWMKSKEYRKAYEELGPEFALARAVIQARVTAGLTQEQLAERMDTTQSVIARLESGRTRPSTQTLQRLAAATGTRLRISFDRSVAV